jgi:hypothetical protein
MRALAVPRKEPARTGSPAPPSAVRPEPSGGVLGCREVWRGRTAPRNRGSGRPLGVVVLNEILGDSAELPVEFVQVFVEFLAFKLMLHSANHEGTQASVADVLLDLSGEVFVDADGPLADCPQILP